MTPTDYNLAAALAVCLVWVTTGRSPVAWAIRGLLHLQAIWACLQTVCGAGAEAARRTYHQHYDRASRRAGE